MDGDENNQQSDVPVTVNFSNCLCHVVKQCSSAKVNFSSKSWETFRSAAKLRQDYIYDSLKGYWDSGPKGVYHRECYQTYTSTCHIDRVLKVKQEHEGKRQPDDELPELKKKLKRAEYTIDKCKCFICRKSKSIKTKTGRTHEPLMRCMTEQACNLIKKVS